MFKNILFIILVLLFLTACSDSNSMRFDYSDMDNTSGLTVEPANILQFQDKNRGDVLKFKLHFSSSELTPLGIDNKTADYGSVFQNNPPFEPVDCLSEVAYNGFCTLSIKMDDNATEGASGSIKLMFYYNLDTNEDTIGEIKYHQLKFEYRNEPLEVPDNSTGGTPDNSTDNNTDNNTAQLINNKTL